MAVVVRFAVELAVSDGGVYTMIVDANTRDEAIAKAKDEFNQKIATGEYPAADANFSEPGYRGVFLVKTRDNPGARWFEWPQSASLVHRLDFNLSQELEL